MARKSREQLERTGRIPVSSNRAPLAVKDFDQTNYVGRWVNDDGDRISMFLQGGYEFVDKDTNVALAESTVDSSSGLDSRMKKPVGRGMFAYLMRLPRDLYEQDQKAKQKDLDSLVEAIKRPGKGGPVAAEYGQVSLSSDKGEENVQFNSFGKKI